MPGISSIKPLGDKTPGGVYRAPLGYLQSQSNKCAREDMQWHIFPRLETVIRESLLDALNEALCFPDYFGHNWDAAWDCLSEQVWPLGKLQILYLRIAADVSLAESDLRTFVELMNDACKHWAEQHTACYVLIESDRYDSQTLNELSSLPGELESL